MVMKFVRERPIDILVFIALVVFFIAILLPVQGHSGGSPIMYRQSVLRSLITAMNNYADEFDGQLVSADQWHGTMDPWLGIAPDDPIYLWDNSYAYYMLPIPWESLQMPKDISVEELQRIPFMFEDPEFQKEYTSVSFWDGSVRQLTDDEFAVLIDPDLGIPLGVPSP